MSFELLVNRLACAHHITMDWILIIFIRQQVVDKQSDQKYKT